MGDIRHYQILIKGKELIPINKYRGTCRNCGCQFICDHYAVRVAPEHYGDPDARIICYAKCPNDYCHETLVEVSYLETVT